MLCIDSEMNSDNGTRLLDAWLSSVEYAMLHWTSIIIPPPVILTGVVGNPLAAGVLLRLPPPITDLSAARYAVALLVVNTVRLFAEGALEWLAYATSTTYIIHKADWVCRLWKFLRLPAVFLTVQVPAVSSLTFYRVFFILAIVYGRSSVV